MGTFSHPAPRQNVATAPLLCICVSQRALSKETHKREVFFAQRPLRDTHATTYHVHRYVSIKRDPQKRGISIQRDHTHETHRRDTHARHTCETHMREQGRCSDVLPGETHMRLHIMYIDTYPSKETHMRDTHAGHTCETSKPHT